MTNEEMAVLAAQGDRESQHKLYFAVAPLIYKKTSRYFKYCEKNRRGVKPEDLVQCGYFAYLNALKQYSPEKEAEFAAYLGFCIKAECWRELGIVFRPGKVVNREVEAVSLDTPLSSENEDITLESTIADPDADIAEFAELNEMQIIVRQEVERLTVNEQLVIYGMFYEDKTLEEIAAEEKWDFKHARKVKWDAYHTLRYSEDLQQLRKAYDWGWNKGGHEYLNLANYSNRFIDNGLTPIGGERWK